jgi:hypothetical protein
MTMAIRNEFLETCVGSPPEGWTLGHVTMTLHHPEERIPVEAWRKGAFAVHPTENPAGARLSHAPTGLSIYQARSMDEAIEFADRIEPFTDWEAIKEKMPAGSTLYPKVRLVRMEFDDRHLPA